MNLYGAYILYLNVGGTLFYYGILLLMLLLVIFLTRTIKKLSKELQLKKQEIEMLNKTNELYLLKALKGKEKERKRIAQDLHDQLGSMLSTVKLYLQKYKNNVVEIHGDDFEKANKLLDDACNEVRRIAHNLIAGVLENYGLIKAVKELKGVLIDTGLYEVELVVHNFTTRLPIEYEIELFHIVQELTSNILRHSEATEISYQFIRRKNNLHITVEDNGNGFVYSESKVTNGLGIKNISSRLKALNGVLTIDTMIGRGTSVFIELPLKILVND